MKVFFFIISTILIFSCETVIPQGEKPLDFSEIERELVGATLKKDVEYLKKSFQNQDIDVTIFTHQNKKKLTELDIYFRNLEISTYSELRDFYNTTFNGTYSDSVYNTWQTDSTEFILYRNSDSSILVNIFKRT